MTYRAVSQIALEAEFGYLLGGFDELARDAPVGNDVRVVHCIRGARNTVGKRHQIFRAALVIDARQDHVHPGMTGRHFKRPQMMARNPHRAHDPFLLQFRKDSGRIHFR